MAQASELKPLHEARERDPTPHGPGSSFLETNPGCEQGGEKDERKGEDRKKDIARFGEHGHPPSCIKCRPAGE